VLVADGTGELGCPLEDQAQAIAGERYPCFGQQGQRIIERAGERLGDCGLQLKRGDAHAVF
jgi:hypothetical protein